MKLSPAPALNDSDNKGEAALEDLRRGISHDKNANHAVPSLPKAPRLQLSSPELYQEQKSCQDGNFNMADLEREGPFKPPAERVSSPNADNSNVNHGTQEACNKNLFGGGDVTKDSNKQGMFGGGHADFSFNFDKDESLNDNSFSFFGGGGDCKSPEGKGDGDFFLNLGDDDGNKMEEGGGFNLF